MTSNSGDKRIKEQVDNMQVSFDKEAAWMRLQDRLESKDEKKPYFRIAWAAAAMLVLATVLWFAVPQSKKAPLAKEIPVALPAVTVEASVSEPAQPVIMEKKEPVVVVHQDKKQKPEAIVRKDSTPIIKHPIPEPVIAKEETPIVPEAPKVVLVPKPKMRTVHINEIAHEQMFEERMRQSRYAVEKNFLSPKQTVNGQLIF